MHASDTGRDIKCAGDIQPLQPYNCVNNDDAACGPHLLNRS